MTDDELKAKVYETSDFVHKVMGYQSEYDREKAEQAASGSEDVTALQDRVVALEDKVSALEDEIYRIRGFLVM